MLPYSESASIATSQQQAAPDVRKDTAASPTVVPLLPAPTTTPTWRSATEARSQLAAEDTARLARPITFVGRIVTDATPVSGARISSGGQATTSADDGSFSLAGLKRHNTVVDVQASGHLPHRQAIQLDVSASTTTVDVGTVRLEPRTDDRSRIVFGGDVALGRRYLDPTESARRDEVPAPSDDALIRADTAYADTSAILTAVDELLDGHDFATLNLESVVTTNPALPWEERNYVMFSLPASVAALHDAGVDHVSLGNNHIWDYNQPGVRDTLGHLDEIGMAHSGAGAGPVEAFMPHLASLPNGEVAALHSFVSIEGVKVINNTAARPGRGGGADLNDGPAVRATLEASDQAGHLTIALPHTGYEYTESPPPDDFTVRKLRALVDLGSDLVVANHPHIPQGFEFHNNRLIAYSLGNLAFDQLRLDTIQSLALIATFAGRDLVEARVVPLFIDGFVPQWGTGASVDLLLRRLSWLSGDDVVLVAEGGGARIDRRGEVESLVRAVEVTLEPDATGTAYVDLRQLRRPQESLGSISGADADATSYGRDLMVFGDMEDPDADDVAGETPFWAYGEGTLRCNDTLRGSGALCSLREDTNTGPASISFTRRIRVLGDRINLPNKDLTLVFHAAGDNRGTMSVEATLQPSQGDLDFGTRTIAELPAGTASYEPHWVSVPMPPDDPATIAALEANHPYDPTAGFINARAVRFSFRHHPPEAGVGVSKLDDVALVSWEAPTSVTPNPFDFVRIANATPGQVVTIEFVSYR